MLFRKKLLFFLVGTGGAAGISSLISGRTTHDNKIAYSDWDQVYTLTKNIRDIEISSFLDPNIDKVNQTKSLYSLFSTNLGTFSDSFNKNFYKWSLYKWATWLLNNTARGSFPGIKATLSQALEKVKYTSDHGAEGTPLNSQHWTKLNNLITSANSDLNNAFLKFFFDTIFRKSDGSDIEQTEEQLKTFGDLPYAKSRVEFQKFIFDEWIATQKPVIICKKSWNYSSEFTKNTYSTDAGTAKGERPAQPNINFPEFYKESISSFNKTGKCDEDITVLTNEDVAKLDGREIDAFIFKYLSEINKKEEDGEIENQGTDLTTELTNINEIFFEDNKVTGSNIEKHNSSVIGSGTLSNKKDKYPLSFRQVKFGSDENKKGIYVKTETGLTFFYWNSTHNNDETRKEFLKESGQSVVKNFNLSQQLRLFFVSRPGELISKYLAKEGHPLPGGIFGDKSWSVSLYNLANKVADFSEELRKNKLHWETMSQLSSSVKNYEKITFGADKKPEFSAGLGLPLWMKRNLNKSSAVTNNNESYDVIGLKHLNTNGNNGIFPHLSKYLDRNWKIEGLHSKASNLKSAIADHLNSVSNPVIYSHSNSQSSYYLGDYVLDNVYNTFLTKDDGKFIKRATISLLLANDMGFNWSSNDLNSFVERIVGGMDVYISDQEAVTSLLTDSIKNIYYGSQYIAEPIEKKINYGGFKWTKPVDCVRAVKEDGAINKKCETSESNMKEWIQKTNDYWLMKNYVFGEDGYELGSQTTTDYVRFLYSLYGLSKDGFRKLRQFVSSYLPTGRYGALVWMENAENVNSTKPTGNALYIGEAEGTSAKNFDKYFRNPHLDNIFNPYFNREITVEASSSKQLLTGHVGAFAAMDKESKELFGFKGLYTETLNGRDLQDNVYKAIFGKFDVSNPKNNKNFLSSSTSATITQGLAFGELVNSTTWDVEKRIDEFSTQDALYTFLKHFFPKAADDVWDSKIENKTIPLPEVKEIIKRELKDKYKDHITALTTRFSGLIKHPESADTIYSKQPYYIPDSKSSSNGYIVYMIQVNRYDFNGGFSDFVKTIGADTFLKMVISLASQNRASQNVVTNYLSLKGVIV